MAGEPRGRHALWASTSQQTRGGVAACVRTLLATPLRERWSVEHVATHRNGSRVDKARAFLAGGARFAVALARRPAVVHLHMSANGSFVRKAGLAWLTYATGIPVVLHVHGGDFLIFHDRVPRPVQRLITATLTRADAVIALGERWADRLRSIAPAAAVTVVPNAIVMGEPVAQRQLSGPVHVVFLGDMIEDKGVFVLLEAWARAGFGQPGTARLSLAGSGELDRAAATIEELGIGSTVQLLGWVEPAAVPALLRTAQVLTLPSRFEGQPMVLLEAMANGLCVVASDVGGIPDMIDTRSGVLVPPDDAESLATGLKRVVADGPTRAELAANAAERARREFDIEVVWRRIDALYETVGARRGRG